MSKLDVFSSLDIINDFDAKLEGFIKVKEPMLYDKKRGDKNEIKDYMKSLTNDEKGELAHEIDEVLSGGKTLNDVVFSSSSLREQKYINVFYRVSKFYFTLYLQELKRKREEENEKKYDSMSEKQLLIEIIRMLKNV